MSLTRIDSFDLLRAFAKGLLSAYPQGAAIGLSGELGAGKTTLVRTFVEVIAQSAGKKLPRVTSPSFVLHQTYSDLPIRIDHFDLYRLPSVEEGSLFEMGYFEALETCRNQGGFVFVEWPERVGIMSLLRLDLRLALSFEGQGRVVERLPR